MLPDGAWRPRALARHAAACPPTPSARQSRGPSPLFRTLPPAQLPRPAAPLPQELVASARSASPQRRQAARPPARRPPARKRKQVSSEEEEDSDLDDEEDDYEGGYVRSAVLTRGRRTRHVKTMDADMVGGGGLLFEGGAGARARGAGLLWWCG